MLISRKVLQAYEIVLSQQFYSMIIIIEYIRGTCVVCDHPAPILSAKVQGNTFWQIDTIFKTRQNTYKAIHKKQDGSWIIIEIKLSVM